MEHEEPHELIMAILDAVDGHEPVDIFGAVTIAVEHICDSMDIDPMTVVTSMSFWFMKRNENHTEH